MTAAARTRPRNLVVVRAGKDSLHPGWVAAGPRDFVLFVSEFGPAPVRWREGADLHEHRLGPKWPCLAALLRERPALAEDFDAVWFPDDDLATDGATIDRMFAFFHAHRLHLAQPALTRDSFHTWSTLLQEPGCLLRLTGFVEVMAPIFSREALAVCAPTFGESPSGWGLDWVWPTLLRRASLGSIGVIDATPVRHTRPLGGELYRNHRELDPRADADRLLRRYGLQEVRAVAKYSIAAQVQARPLPLHRRLVFWLKRLNGRRKQLQAR